MILTTGEISDILSLSSEKTKQIIPIFIKKQYLTKVGDKYSFTDEGRKYLEYLHESNVLKK